MARLYPNLLYNIFQKIPEKYHPYLRFASSKWEVVSKWVVSPQVPDYVPRRELKRYVRKGQIIHLGAILKNCEYFDMQCLFEKSCRFGDAILIKITLDNCGDAWTPWANYFHSGFYLACKGGQVKTAQLMYLMAMDSHDPCFGTGLACACRSGNLAMVEYIFDTIEQIQNAGGRVSSWLWDRTLKYACYGGNPDIVGLIIQKGKADNFQFAWNWGLEGACRGGHLGIIQLMLDKGAWSWDAGLAGACRGANYELAKMILKKNITQVNACLSSACRGGDLRLVQLMLDDGANIKEISCIEKASWGGHLEVVKFIENKPCFLIPHEHRKICLGRGLQKACIRGNLDVVQFLLEKGAKIRKADIWLFPQFIKKYLEKHASDAMI